MGSGAPFAEELASEEREEPEDMGGADSDAGRGGQSVRVPPGKREVGGEGERGDADLTIAPVGNDDATRVWGGADRILYPA